jgi:RNA 3'-terminal phosphate cyclase (RTC), insert domain
MVRDTQPQGEDLFVACMLQALFLLNRAELRMGLQGGGEVQLSVPTVRVLPPVSLLQEGMVKRVRGVAHSMRVSPQNSNRMVRHHATCQVELRLMITWRDMIIDIHLRRLLCASGGRGTEDAQPAACGRVHLHGPRGGPRGGPVAGLRHHAGGGDDRQKLPFSRSRCRRRHDGTQNIAVVTLQGVFGAQCALHTGIRTVSM